jgi:hypothetical protein
MYFPVNSVVLSTLPSGGVGACEAGAPGVGVRERERERERERGFAIVAIFLDS